jgi:glycosyltransferase involved in cell wall biosynthesis
MTAPLVSVILPFFNAQATLEEAIESIRAQTFTDWELVLLDDGSSDHSPAIAHAARQTDPRVRLLSAEHGGIVAALDRACAAARGAFLARMDADDIAAPERIERQLTLMEACPDAGLCGTRISSFGEPIGPGRRRYETWVNALVTPEDIARELFVECPVPHPTFFLRRSAFEQAGGYQEHGWPEDYDLVMRIWQAGWKIIKAPESLLCWRHSAARLSATDPRYTEQAFRALKRHYLARTYLRDRAIFHQWGAGEVGKRWLREWGSMAPAAVVDINPRKIGRRIHGVRVIPPEEIPPPGETFVVVAVGTPGARDDIRARLTPRGYRETRDYVFLA